MGLCILAVNKSKQHLAMLKYCKNIILNNQF